PRTVQKTLLRLDTGMAERDYAATPAVRSSAADASSREETAELLRSEMLVAAEQLDFERAAHLRDRIKALEAGEGTPSVEPSSRTASRKAASKNRSGGGTAPQRRRR
ncbi:MAG: UvrB/uvrC motif, partial [Pseudomonadota bacterium]